MTIMYRRLRKYEGKSLGQILGMSMAQNVIDYTRWFMVNSNGEGRNNPSSIKRKFMWEKRGEKETEQKLNIYFNF